MKQGKWKVIPIKGLIESRIATDEEFVGTVFNDFAPLVAAAPELLEACKGIVNHIQMELKYHNDAKTFHTWVNDFVSSEGYQKLLLTIMKAEEGK